MKVLHKSLNSALTASKTNRSRLQMILLLMLLDKSYHLKLISVERGSKALRKCDKILTLNIFDANRIYNKLIKQYPDT